MTDFIAQSIHLMAETYERATGNKALADELKAHNRAFHKKAQQALADNEQE
jgi:hypothetical protein